MPEPSHAPADIAARHLTVTLGHREVLRDIAVSVEGGSWVGLIGPNGSGKTTFLRSLAGLLEYRGSLTLRGVETRDWRPRDLAKTLAFVRQSTAISFDFTVADFVLLGRVPYGGLVGGFSPDDRRRLDAVLEETDLSGLESRSIQQLSGGELQRAVLAQALLQEPSVLLLDEPTTHLDVEHQFRLLSLVNDRAASHGLTVISSFHDLELAARFSDTLLVLSEGQVAASGEAPDVLTPELLRDVFRVRARVEAHATSPIRIEYDGAHNIGHQLIT
jgi:iron complex transport system ATP-binding protein